MTQWAFVGAVVLAIGTVPAVWQFVTDPERRLFYGVLAGITGIAAGAYAAMGLGTGVVTTAGHSWDVLRYVDWLVTTPLIVFYLAMLVEPDRRTYLVAVVADVAMIGFGAVGNVLSPPLRYAAFAAGAAAFGYLSYLLYVRFERESTVDSMDRRALFEKLRNLTIVLWGIYPVVWLLSSTGIGLLFPVTEEIVTIYLDVLTKVGFALIAVNGSETIDAGVSSALDAAGDAGATDDATAVGDAGATGDAAAAGDTTTGDAADD